MDLVKRMITEADKEKIRASVRAAEARTSGEIVPMIVSSSGRYPLASVIGAVVFALPLSVLLASLIGGRLWLGRQDMWIFLAVFTLLFICFHALIERLPPLKRVFVSAAEVGEAVSQAATSAFFTEGLYRTRDETGVLIFVSVFERKVWVLADRGINEKVAQESWERIVAHIVSGIRSHRAAEAIGEAVTQVADLLEAHFPVRPDDRNELKDLIVDS